MGIGDVAPAIQIHVHVYHHFEEPLPVTVTDPIFVGRARQPAVGAALSVGERSPMATAQVNVDTVNEIATVSFVDDKGDVDALQPEGSVIGFTSSDESVLTVAPSPDNPAVGDITVVGEGSADIGATVTDADGNALVDAAGNAWTAIESTTVTVVAGAAVGARLAVSGTDTV